MSSDILRMSGGRILVTGSNGFVGRAFLARLKRESQVQIRVALRSGRAVPAEEESVVVGNLENHPDWQPALAGVATVVHLAARVHVMRESACDPLAEFRKLNVDATLALARQAAAVGVRRFVYVSSIKVNGEVSMPGRAFTAEDPAAPHDAYAISKHEAEAGLKAVANETGMEVVIVRPPLVYGPGVRANFLAMLRWVDRGWPLPFASIRNQRSLVAVDNLSDLLVRCLFHPAAGNRVFLASDHEDLSTPELLRRLGRMLGKPARLIPFPPRWLLAGGTLIGRRAELQRLGESLQIDTSKTATLLGWNPPVTVDEALRKTIEHYRKSGG